MDNNVTDLGHQDPPVAQDPAIFQNNMIQAMQQLNQQVQNQAAQIQNFQHGQNNNAGHAAKPPKPQTFSGERDAREVRVWAHSVGIYFDCVNQPAAHRVPYAAALLRGQALVWLMNQPTVPDSWEAFSAAIISYFAPVGAQVNARNELARLRQLASVRAYTRRFRSLLLEITDMSEAEKMDRYRRGLKPGLQYHVNFVDPDNFEELCLTAERVDAITVSTWRDRSYAGAAARGHWYSGDDGAGPSNSVAVPMELGAEQPRSGRAFPPLTDVEREALKASGGCFYCRKSGHRALQCPAR
jgi:hypothetical protein